MAFKEILFNDGEGLDYNDFNTMQRQARALVCDGLLANRARTEQSLVSTIEQGHLFAIGLGGAPQVGGGALTVTNHAGVIAFPTSISVGLSDPNFLVYYLSAGELLSTLAVGDATNPRIDLICVKLEQVSNDAADNETRDFKDATTGVITSQTMVKRRKVKLTKQVVAGTPAGSPVEPAVPAGFKKWAAITVPANHNAVFTPVTHQLIDYRMPIGFYTSFVRPGEATSSAWTVDAALSRWDSNATGQNLFIPLTGCGQVGARLLTVSLHYQNFGAGSELTAKLIRRSVFPAAADVELKSVTLAGTSNSPGTQTIDVSTEPYWLHGHRCVDAGASHDTTVLYLKIEHPSGTTASFFDARLTYAY